MKVNIVKLGNPIKEVEVADGSNVMAALSSAGFNVDSVMSVKRNGSAVAMDATLSDGDMLIVTQEKIKGGDTDDTEGANVIAVGFDVTYEEEVTPVGKIGVDASQDLFTTIKEYIISKGLSMNSFMELRDSEGNKIPLSGSLEDGKDYTIVLKKAASCDYY